MCFSALQCIKFCDLFEWYSYSFVILFNAFWKAFIRRQTIFQNDIIRKAGNYARDIWKRFPFNYSSYDKLLGSTRLPKFNEKDYDHPLKYTTESATII